MNRQTDLKGLSESIKHELHLLYRKEMKLCGVKEVLSFDESGVHLLTDGGELIVEGRCIRIGTLDTDHGVLGLSGEIDAMYYVAGSEKKGNRLFGKLFR